MVKQLDLLGETATTSPDRPIGDIDIGVLDTAGQALIVAIEKLSEDPDNPRTEFPDAWLDELAEDIRQHGILQPIVVHPADAAGQHRLHFGALRLRAAKRAGLRHVPIAARVAAADPYAQVAENQKRCPLQPLELARFVRGRSKAGELMAAFLQSPCEPWSGLMKRHKKDRWQDRRAAARSVVWARRVPRSPVEPCPASSSPSTCAACVRPWRRTPPGPV